MASEDGRIGLGESITGYCGGYFGRDDYSEHTVVLTFRWKGQDAAVFVTEADTEHERLVVLAGDQLLDAVQMSEGDEGADRA